MLSAIERPVLGRKLLRRQAHQGRGHHRPSRFVALADQEQIATVLRVEDRGRGILDRDRFAEPCGGSRWFVVPRLGGEQVTEQPIAVYIRRNIALEDDLPWNEGRLVRAGLLGDP